MESSGQNVWIEFFILVFDMDPKTGWNIFDITLLADKQINTSRLGLLNPEP